MRYRYPLRRRRVGRTRRQLGLEHLESRRVLAAQLETGLAFEHLYLSDPDPSGGYGAAVQGDLDGDGRLDVLVFTSLNVAQFFAGQGDGSYSPTPTALPHPYAEANWILTDVDSNGDQDLLSVVESKLLLSLNSGRDQGLWQGLQPVTEQEILSGEGATTFAADDFNGDGIVDLALGTSTAIYVKSGLGDGRFDTGIQYPLGQGSGALVAGDLDDDGDLDVCVGYQGGRHIRYAFQAGVTVFLGRGDGGFGPRLFVADGRPAAVFPRDLDGAGADELTVVTEGAQVHVLRSVTSQLLPAVSWIVSGGSLDRADYAEGDWDGNGVADALAKTVTGLELRLNPGTDSEQTMDVRLSAAWDQAFLRDVTGDGRTDILTIGPSGVYVLPQDEHGRPGELVFTPATATTLISDGIVDLNRDGTADLLLVHGADLYVWLGQGNGSFQPLGDAAVTRGRAFQVADWDTDGHADLMVLWGNRLSILHGSADGSFHETFHIAISADTALERVVDLDGDGDLDVVLREAAGPQQTGTARVMINTGDGSLEEIVQTLYYSFVENVTEKLLVNWSDNELIVLRATSDQPWLTEVLRETSTEGGYNLEAVADLDQEGHLDLAVQGPGGVHVFVGSADGSLSELAVANSYRFADFNRDGLLDLLNVSSGILQILVRSPDVGHTEAYRQTFETDARIDTVVDLEGDGDPDVVLFENDTFRILLNASDATLTQLMPADSYRLADLDADGRDELLVQSGRYLTVYRVDTAGQFVQTFQAITASVGSYIDTVADLDTDGDLDVILRNRNNRDYTEILLGAGDATLNELATARHYQFADWNSDGHTDLLYIYGSRMTVLLGDGAGNFHQTFGKTVASESRLESTVDLDGDGDRDVVLRQGSDVRIMINSGDAHFEQLARVRGYQFADWNGDTRMDLLTWSSTQLVVETAGENGQFEEVFQMPLGNEDSSIQVVRDLDGDGDLDFILRSHAVYIMMNVGDATFSRLDLPAVDGENFDLRDINGDGWLDILGWEDWGDMIVFFGDEVEPYRQTMRLPPRGAVQFLDDPIDLDRDGYVDQVIAWQPRGPGTRVMVLWGSPPDRPRTPIDLVFPRRTGGDLPPVSISISARDVDHNGDYDLVLSDVRVIYNHVDELRPWGDVDGNGRIDVRDVDTLSAAIRLQDPRLTLFDLNQDGVLDRGDLSFLVRDVLGTHPGDADLNGVFNSSDMVSVFQIGEYEDSVGGNSTWADGDWNGDGDFNSSDLVLAFQAGGYTTAARGVPPPTLTAIAADVAQALQALPGSQTKQQRRPARR